MDYQPEDVKALMEAADHLSWAMRIETQGGRRSRSFIRQHRAKCQYWIRQVGQAIEKLDPEHVPESEK